MREGTNRIQYLDGIRGLAAYMVMASHFAIAFIGSAVPDFLQSWVRLGRFGVQIFYILSGFLIAYGFYKKNSGGGGKLLAETSLQNFTPVVACNSGNIDL